jgi:hypothetical protein
MLLTDVDGTSQDHRRAVSGHSFTVHRFTIDSGTISWSLQKQELVTLTAEAKFVTVTPAAKEYIGRIA